MDELNYIISELLKEQGMHGSVAVPKDILSKRNLMRSLMNVRPASPASIRLLKAQDIELGRQLVEKGIVHTEQTESSPSDSHLRL